MEQPRLNGSAPPAWTGEVVADAEKIRGALKVIPSDDYETWFRVGGALWSCVRQAAFSEDMGRQLFHEWSATSAKYDTSECDRRWDQCATLTEVSAGTIFYLAEEADPNWLGAHRAEQGEVEDEEQEPAAPDEEAAPGNTKQGNQRSKLKLAELLERMNEEFFVIPIGGQARVGTFNSPLTKSLRRDRPTT